MPSNVFKEVGDIFKIEIKELKESTDFEL